jgi:hypothetical protein
MKNNRLSILIILFAVLQACEPKPRSNADRILTYCNPMDLSYRFALDDPSRREAADPTVVWFRDRYYLFASKSGGYWHSENLIDWTFIETGQIPSEEYAPTAIAIEDKLYFLASSTEKSTIYTTADPLSGQWTIAREELEIPVWDPAFFLDTDNRLYLYWGCSNEAPIYGVELDYNDNFSFIGEPKELKHADPESFGWEVPGDYNTLTDQSPWIEGAWMNKINDTYYLQYSGPGTEYKSYSDAVYSSNSPLGPYDEQGHNPFAYKPEGFAAGAGHGSTFKDRYGNYWHIGTITISTKHIFERRLGLYPAFLDENGTFFCNTKYGDYPMKMPAGEISDFEDVFTGWMLLSYKKNVTVSSSIDSLEASNMTDENIRTYWAAKTGDEGEFAALDLGDSYEVKAVQLNFAEHDAGLRGRNKRAFHRFRVEHSGDGEQWETLIDNSKNQDDRSHFYFQIEKDFRCRFLRITNLEVPGGHLAISGFRVFGTGHGEKPDPVETLIVSRNPNDGRSVELQWDRVQGADGYNISYGTDPDRLYHNYLVYQDTVLTINSLHAEREYHFTVEAFNENGRSSVSRIGE